MTNHPTPLNAGIAPTRNIQTRDGYDFWDKLCAIPRYGFLLAPEGNRVVKADGIGNWIDRDEAMIVVDDAQSEINLLRAEVRQLKADAARMDWLEAQCEACGFQDIHEGNRWVIDGPFATARDAIDAALNQGGKA